MSEVNSYNGWSNYETWCVHLWLTNDESTYNMCREWAQEAKEEAKDHPYKREAKGILADMLNGYVEDNSPLANIATMYTDLLNAAISEVDWIKIAKAFLEE
jgi:hypothetical protein